MSQTASQTEQRETTQAFQEAVNMTAREIERWLETKESRSVGQTKPGAHEAIGHQSGRKIIDLLNKSQSDYTEADFAHMHKVVSYVKRHMAQGPTKSDPETSDWRYSLMNWGHDPCKK